MNTISTKLKNEIFQLFFSKPHYLILLLFSISFNVNAQVISGTILTENGSPMEGVTVKMEGDQTMNILTDASGTYSFPAVNVGSNVVIIPDFSPSNCQDTCINVLDLVHTRRLILNIDTSFPSPFGGVNADATGNRVGNIDTANPLNGISTSDLNAINSQILGVNQLSDCWKFVDASFVFPNTNDVNVSEIVFNNIQNNEVANFIGLRTGDVNACANNTEADFLGLQLENIPTNSCNALATSFSMPLTVTNFNVISGLQFSLIWDPTILQFQGISSFSSTLGISAANLNSNNSNTGELNFSWYDSNASGISLNDGDALFSLQFSVIDDQSATIAFSDVNTHQLVVSDQLTTSNPITTNGGIIVDTIECDTVSLFLADATANCGEQICVDVTTTDFQDVFSFQFSLNWDPNILEFTSVGQFGVSGLGASSFLQNTPGELGVAWADPSALGVTIPDGSSLFQICFSAKDVNNATGDVIFSNSPTFTEFVNNENILINNLNNGQITVNCPSCMSAFSYNLEDCNSVQFTNQSLGNNLTYAWNFGDGNSSTDEHPLHNYTNNGTYTAQLITSDNLGCKDTTETDIVINVNNQLNLVCNDNVAVTINSGQKLAITSQLILESFPSPDCAVDTIIFSPDTLDCTNVGANNVTATLTDINGAASSCTTVVTVTGSCDSVSFAVSDIIGNCGEQVCVNVTTANFQDILSFQFSLNWDASIVQLTSFGQFGITDLTTGNFQQTTPGEIGVSWFHNSTIGVSVPDGTSLFQLCFEAHEVNNATSNLVFSNSPSPIEMVNNNGEVAHKLTDGQIAIDCPFTFTCPPDVTINQSILPAVTGEPTFDNPALIDTFFYTDVLSEVCEPVIYERTWTMTDVNGNTSTCVQILSRATVDINDIILPPDITVDYCSGDAQAIGLEHTGTPTIYDAQLSTNEYVLGFILAFDDNMTSPTQITKSFKVVYWCDPNPAPVDIGQQIITKDTTNCSCIAAFNYDIEDVCGTVQFMNQSTQANSNPLTHSWNFGDGTTSTDEHPQHIYTTDGTYIVQLITRDNLGCADTTDTQITITIDNQGPQVICNDNLTVSINADEVLAITHQLILESFPTDVCGIDTITFNPDSLDCTNAGNNDIIATVTDNNGNVSSCTAIVTLQVGPDANAQFFPPTPLFVYESGYDISQNVSPLGGTFSGAGINGVIFEPASAGVGIHAITYTYNNNKNCPISITADIEVLSSNLTLCDSTHISDSNARGHRDSCCHTIILGNQLANRFTSVKISTLNSTTFWPPAVTPTFLGGTLVEKSSTPNSIELIAPTQNTGICTSGNLDYLPVFGNRDIFDLCLKNATHSTNPILIEWLDCDNVICQDTINLTCPECPVINDTLVCRDDSLKYQFQIVNNFYHNIDTIKLHYIEPAGATISPNPLVLANPILSGTTSPMLEVHLDNVGNASNIKMLLEFNEIDCCFCIPDTIDLAIPVCNNYCTDSLMFCQKVDQGWMINTNDLTVDITAPQFDTCHWIVASPDWGDNANSSNCTDNVFFEIGIDGISQKDSLKCCSAGNNRFEDDNTTDGILYLDTAPRNDIYTICPTNDRYNLTATLTSFDIAQGDVLMVFDGMDVNAPFLASGSGVGVSNFNNGFVFSNPSLAVNPSGCLTFQFQTNGDNMKGSGWEMSLICEERAQPLNQTWTHTYDNPGTYIICAEVFEGNPNTLDVCWSKQMCDTITVGGCQPYFICPDDLLVADCPLTFDPNTLPAPTLVDTCVNSMPTMISSIETLITNDCSVKHIITWELLDNGILVDLCRYLVEVKDTIKPSIICPNNINLSVDLNCQVALPDLTSQATITDNCSPIDSLIITQNPPAGTMLMPNIHNVSIIVEDECGNIDSCILQVNVEDNIAPTAICRDPINLSLSSSGFIVITAANVNNGSFDNCGIDTMYLDKYTFNCSDIGTSPTVTLTVVDIYGNSNSCISQVNIEIKIPNTFQCPSDTCLTAPMGVDSLQVNFTAPTFRGVCSNRFISCDYQSGDFFPCDTTVVTCMAVDTMLNDTVFCSFNVIVKKEEKTCCQDSLLFCQKFDAGFMTSIDSCGVTILPTALDSCHSITYTFGDQSTPTSIVDGSTSVGHAYAAPGNYTICATVEELDDNGVACWTKDTCWTVCVDCDTCTTPELYNVAACYAGNTINFSGYDQQMDIEYHPSGQYYYTTGSIIGNSYCGAPVTAYGGMDLVISKIDNTTDNVIQAFTFDGTGDDIGRVIKYLNGHIYVAGAFTSDTLRIPSPGDNELSAKTLQSTGAVHTTFLAKYDANFKLIWAFSLNGIRTTIEDIAIGNTNEVAITGLFQGANVDFNPLNTAAPFTISSGSNHSGYVAKYTPNGNLLWANSYTVTTVPTPISVSSAGYGVGIDQQNNTYVTGEFTGNLTISTNNNNNPISTTYSDTVARAFLIQIDNIGNTTWHTDIKSTPGNATSGWDIAFDNNDMYVAGWSGFITKYDISPSFQPVPSIPVQKWYYDVGYDIYEIAITNQQLQTFGTQKRRPRGPANPDRGIIGYNFDFKNDAVPIPSRGGWDMVLAYYDLEGNFLKGINVGGGLFEIGHGIAAHNGETVIIGHFDSSNLEYDPKNSNNIFTLSATPPTTNRGIFIGKYACKCPIEIECPQDISIDVPIGTDSIQVSFDPPTMSGFCDRIITCDYQSGDFFPCDTTVVTCMAIDTLVNDTAFCYFNVIVNKVDTCAIRCPSDIVITAAPNSSGLVVPFDPPTLSSGCDPSYTVSCSHNSGDVFPCGTTTVTCTVSDGNGNAVETCTFTVTINCSCQPIILCPADAIVDCCNDFNFVPPTLRNPSCGNGKILICKRDDGLSLTAPYPSGVTAITCIADSDLGWIDSCTYFVTVLDTIPPMLNCPIDTVVTVMDSCQYILPDFRPIVNVSDSCDPTSGIIVIQQPSPGVILTPGFHPITIIASDSCGNEDSCVIDLTINCIQDNLCCQDSLSLDSMIYAVFDSAIINCDTLCLKPIPDTCNLHWMVDWGDGNNTPWDGVTDSICQVYNYQTPTNVPVCITVFELNDDGETCRTQTICDTFLIESCGPPIDTFCGKAVVTCFPSFNNNNPTQGINLNSPVLGIVDIRDRSGQPSGQYWSGASGTNIYHANIWNYQNLGLIFGLALDNQNNIYTSSTTTYGCAFSTGESPFGPSGLSRIYQIDPSDNISVFINEGPFVPAGTGKNIPSSGAGFGNICYDSDNDQLFVTNMADGMIYRIKNGLVVDRFDPFTTSNAPSSDNPDFVDVGERTWGIAYYNDKIYFSRWQEDRSRRDPTLFNEIWSVTLNNLGGFNSTSISTQNTYIDNNLTDNLVSRLELSLPDHIDYYDNRFGTNFYSGYSNPVSDIAFTSEGVMLLAERSMYGDCGNVSRNPVNDPNVPNVSFAYYYAHQARVLEYEQIGNNWALTPEHGLGVPPPFTDYLTELKYILGNTVSNAPGGANSSGGVDYGYGSFTPDGMNNQLVCDEMAWLAGDWLQCPTATRVYGMLGVNANTGGNSCTGYGIDYDGFTTSSQVKVQQGDVEIFKCFDCPKDETDCDSLMVMVNPISMPDDSTCCYTIDLKNNVSTDVTKVCFDLFDNPDWILNTSTINIPGFTWSVATGNQICLENSAGIPLGMNVGVMDFCLAALAETARDTQCLAVSWFKGREQIACTDTLKTFCQKAPPGDPCFVISNVSIDCTDGDDNSYCMNFDVTNMTGFDASGIILNSLPSGYLFDDCGCGGSPFGLGDYAFDFGISTPLLPNQTRSLCIKITSIQPVLSPIDVCFFGALQSFTECCKSPDDICVTLNPCCSPCESMQVNVDELDGECCYAIDVDYSCDYTAFNKISFDITSSAIFGSHTITDANWTTCTTPNPQSVCIEPITPGGIPAGLYDDLFEFCLSNTQLNTTETMKVTYWMLDQNGQDSMACDTLLEFVCDTISQPCVFITDEEIICLPDSSKYRINLTVQNISNNGLVADGILIQPFSTEISPNPINFASPLPNDGSTETISFCYEPAIFPDSDDELVLIYKLFQGNYHNCCNGNETILDTLMLPPCDTMICTPIVICPADTCINLMAGETGVIVDYELPIDTNNCEVEIICDPAPGTEFFCGTTPVVCTIIDLQTGNRSFCEFNVIVKCDTMNCEVDLICPMDEFVNCCEEYSFAEPVLTDTCGNAQILSCTRDDGLPISAPYGVGATCITCIAGNDFGWLDTCKYTVTVLDTIPPFIDCPNDTLFNLLDNCNYTLPDVTGWATILDDCNFTVTQNPIAGTIFPDGIHPIQIIVTDDCGNVNACSFNLTIVCDTMPPMSVCCKDSLALCELADVVFNNFSLSCDTLCFEPVLDNCDLDWSIDWGDGNSGTWNPNQPNICHDYDIMTADNFVVCLTVEERNPDGSICQQKIICDTIFIDPCPPPIMETCCKDTADFNKRIANLTITPIYNNCEILVNVTGLDTCDVIYWNWGDGQTDGPLGNNSPISHTYFPSGPYTVCYTVAQMNSLGDTCFSKMFCLPIQVECEDPSCDSLPIIKTFSTTIVTDLFNTQDSYEDQGLSGIDLLDGNIRLAGHSWAYGRTANEMIPELTNDGTLIQNHIKDNQLVRNQNEYPQDIHAFRRKGITRRSQGLAVTGYVRNSNSRSTDLFLQTLRPDGSIIATVHHGASNANERGNALIADTQNRFVVAGQFNGQAHAVKFNSSLSQVWGKTISFSGETATLLNVTQIKGLACFKGTAPFYAFVGYKSNRRTSEGLIVILDKNGDLAYPVQSFSLGAGNVEAYAVAQNNQGQLIITGKHTTPFPNNQKRIFVVNVDCVNERNLQINWSNLYDIQGNIGEFAKSILIDRANNILINGHGYLSEGRVAFTGKKGMAIMMSIPPNGQAINWAHKYFDTDYDGTEFNHLSQTSDGGYLSTGSAWVNQNRGDGGVDFAAFRFRSPVHNYYAVKTDQEGVVSDCDCYEPITVIPQNVTNIITSLTNPPKDYIIPLATEYTDFSGPADQQFCEQYCPPGPCECGDFLDMGFYSDIESQITPDFGLECETGYVLSCNDNGKIAGIKGYFECKGSCDPSKQPTWTLTNTSKGQVVERGSFTLPNINIEFSPTAFNVNGTYLFEMSAYCGDQLCTCSISFLVEDCEEFCSKNRLSNGDFSENIQAGALPSPGNTEFWQASIRIPSSGITTPDAFMVVDDGCSTNGCVELLSEHDYSLITQTIPLNGGEFYELSFCAKNIDANVLNNQVEVFTFITPNFVNLGFSPNLTNTWQNYTITFQQPTNSNELMLSPTVVNAAGRGTIRIDDICLKQIQPDDCDCNNLAANIRAGFEVQNECNQVTLTPNALTTCDQVTIDWGDDSAPTTSFGNQPISHAYGYDGEFKVALKITRTDASRNICVDNSTLPVIIRCFSNVESYQPDRKITTSRNNNTITCGSGFIENGFFENGAFSGNLNLSGSVDGWQTATGNPVVERISFMSSDYHIRLSATDAERDAITQEVTFSPANSYAFSAVIESCGQMTGENSGVCENTTIEVFASKDPLDNLDCTDDCALIGTYTIAETNDTMAIELAAWTPDQTYNFLTIAVKASNEAAQLTSVRIDDVCMEVNEVLSNCCQDSLNFASNVEAGFEFSILDCSIEAKGRQLTDCQQVFWKFGTDSPLSNPVAGNVAIQNQFLSAGNYEVCMLVTEIGADGNSCFEAVYCETIPITACAEDTVCCVNTPEFGTILDNGFTLINENQCMISVAPNILPGDCYRITWSWGDDSPRQTVTAVDSFALSHVYPATNSTELYEVCMVLEIFENGDTCLVDEYCEFVEIDCSNIPVDSCTCTGFDNLNFSNPNRNWAVNCGDTGILLDCENETSMTNFTGTFACSDACEDKVLFWEAFGASGDYFNGFIQIDAQNEFNTSFSEMGIVNPESYTLILNGNCDGNSCESCQLQFAIPICSDTCCIETSVFEAQVTQGFSTEKTCESLSVQPKDLDECDIINWIWGDGTTSQSTGKSEVIHNYNIETVTKLAVEVCMQVSRLDDEGNSCLQSTHCQMITIDNCCSCEDFSFDFDLSEDCNQILVTPTGVYDDCDEIRWKWGDGTEIVASAGTSTATHNYTSEGPYIIQMTVFRSAEGQNCGRTKSRNISINCISTGLEDLLTNKQIRIYPNPVQHLLQIDLNQPLKIGSEIRILNLMGQLTHTQLIGTPSLKHTLSLSNYIPGVYLIEIQEDDFIFREKIVKQ